MADRRNRMQPRESGDEDDEEEEEVLVTRRASLIHSREL